MAYLIDRDRALWMGDVVAVLSIRQRRVRSRVVLRDNSLYNTLTRPATLLRYSHEPVRFIGAGGATGSSPGKDKHGEAC